MSNELDAVGIRRRLDVMVCLLLEISPRNAKSMASKIDFLLEMGLSSTEVGQIVGKPANYVTAAKSNKKKQTAKSRAKEKIDDQQ